MFKLEATGGGESLDVRFEGQRRVKGYSEAADFGYGGKHDVIDCDRTALPLPGCSADVMLIDSRFPTVRGSFSLARNMSESRRLKPSSGAGTWERSVQLHVLLCSRTLLSGVPAPEQGFNLRDLDVFLARYRDLILGNVPQLKALDGVSRSGESGIGFDIDSADLPNLEFLEYLITCDSDAADKDIKNSTNVPVVTPQIDKVLSQYRKRPVTSGSGYKSSYTDMTSSL
ncbi:unnamed protein product [Ranitomeya imitator]|uniref:Uncharacterized protein n=1 Tax=Ranitomeya imitator TaxID=111125 RepID=A0ABN9MBX8_9NEOB|nr:unnamed protein product [Ranitomeya imitator]